MKTFFKRIFPFWLLSAICLIIPTGICYSQEVQSCAEKLKAAQSNFSKGQIEQVPDLLTDCLKSGFKREEELSAYKLLIQTYLLNDKLEPADSTMLSFLRKNPEYQISPTDHSSFVYLYNKFEVKPILQLSVKMGTSFPFLTFKDEDPSSGVQGNSQFKSDISNLFFSLEAKYKLSEKLEAGLELGYSQLQFSYFTDMMSLENIKIGEIKYTEYQKRVEIPLSITCNITTFGKFTPYVRAGLGAALDLSATADASYVVDGSDRLNSDRTGETINRNAARPFIDLYTQIGGGMKYKITRGYFFAVLRLNMGLINQNSHPGLPDTPLESWWYLYSDPGFRLNTLNFSLGYTYIFYKPLKRKV
jgi:hypothetical protein